MPKEDTVVGSAKQYGFSAFDDKSLRRASKIRPLIKYFGFAGLAGLIFVSVSISTLILTPGLVLVVVLLLVLYYLFDRLPGEVFAKQNNLRRPFMKNDSYYYFLYKEYKEAAESALSKKGGVPWGLPIGQGEYAIVFLDNMDIFVWARLAKNFPHIVIDSTGNDRFIGNNIDQPELPIEQVTLEGNFPDYFKVYMEKGQQIISLQILSPDRMASLIDNFAKFDLEIKGNHIKFYGVGLQRNSQGMRFLIDILQMLDEDLKIDRLNKIKVV